MKQQQDIRVWNIFLIFSSTNSDSRTLAEYAISIFKDKKQFQLHSLQNAYLDGTKSIPQNLKDCPKIDYTLSIGQDEALFHAFNLISNNNRINSPIIALSDEPIVSCYSVCHITEVIINLINNILKDKIKTKSIINFDIISQQKKSILKTFTGYVQIHRGMTQGVVRLNLYVRLEQQRDFILLAPFWGDGIVISTPFGSTGRNLSLSGPIIHKDLQSIIILPVCPLSLNFRPIIFPASTQLLIELDQSSRALATIVADSQQVGALQKNQRIIIRKANKKTKMVTGLTKLPSSEAWIMRLHEGMSWAQHYGSNNLPKRISSQKIHEKN